MIDFLILYNPKKPYGDLNKTLVHNIVKIYGDEARVHVYGLKWDGGMVRNKMILQFIDTTQFEHAVCLDSDCLVMKRLDVFDGSYFDVGVTVRKIKLWITCKRRPYHNYLNCGVIFFRRSGRPFFQRWTDILDEWISKNVPVPGADQTSFNVAVLEGAFSLEGTKAYSEGLKPGVEIKKGGMTIKLFDSYKYNYGVFPVGREQYIYHYKDELNFDRTNDIMIGDNERL